MEMMQDDLEIQQLSQDVNKMEKNVQVIIVIGPAAIGDFKVC